VRPALWAMPFESEFAIAAAIGERQVLPLQTKRMTRGPAATTAAPQSLTFEAPPGKLELRMTVEGAGGGVLDQEIRNITIPDLTAARPAISTPRVYAVRTPREFQAIAANAAAVPLAMVSSSSRPGSRRWTCMSIRPGQTILPVASRVRAACSCGCGPRPPSGG